MTQRHRPSIAEVKQEADRWARAWAITIGLMILPGIVEWLFGL